MFSINYVDLEVGLNSQFCLFVFCKNALSAMYFLLYHIIRYVISSVLYLCLELSNETKEGNQRLVKVITYRGIKEQGYK